MLLGTLGASLLGNLLTDRGATNKKGKGIIRAGKGAIKSTRKGKGIVKAGCGRRSLNSFKNNKTCF